MPSETATPQALAGSLQAAQSRVLVSGVLVLAATVTFAVWGPAMDIPYMRDDARNWAAGAMLAGGLLLLTLHGLMLRPLGRLARQHRRDQPQAFGPSGADAELQPLKRELAAAERTIARLRGEVQALVAAAPLAAALPADRAPLEASPAISREASQPALPSLAVSSAAAGRDELTGLLSAAAFEAQLALWLRRAGARHAASLLLIDLDRFKLINETAGRAAGDGVLRQAAAVLQSHVREGDAVARLEGDTYALLLPGCVATVALQMGERLRAALGTLGVDHAGRRLGVGATVGVAELDPAAAAMADGAAQAWMARARAAWYEAKYAGRGGVRLATPAAAVPLVVPA